MDKTTSVKEVQPVTPASPRRAAQVRFPDGRTFEAPIGTPLEAYLRAAFPDPPVPVMAALVDGKLKELTWPVACDVEVTPLTLADSDGVRIYRRSLSFLLVAAAQKLFPQAHVYMDHSLPFGGYFCQVRGREPFTPQELDRLAARMREMIAADLPITKEEVPLDQAVALFRGRGEGEVVRLLTYRRKDYLTLYELNGVRDSFHGYMLPSTGYLRHFALRFYPPGFVLQFPRRHCPTELLPFEEFPQLVTVFQEYGEWVRRLAVEDVGALNEAMEAGRMPEIILVAEALHEQRIAQIAGEIARRRGELRLVLIAGPSASGKTTFARRLAVQLLAAGVRPVAISLDNYFLEREHTPRDEWGEYDFEALETLDLALFNDHLLRLMEGEAVSIPRFNFRTGQREAGETLLLGPDCVLLVEGIHGLNPALVPALPRRRIYRIYVSALTQLNIDHHNRVSTTDSRLIRRIVRDSWARGYSAQETLARWESVRRGEKRHIFPYQENADVMFNSALVYELAVLKPLAEPLLFHVKPSSRARVEGRRLLAFLDWFLPYSSDIVPSNSILREFIGGSILEEFRPWRVANGQ
jgi:uridine kinase